MSKTALVLEGGGMRGLYTAGVLDFFLDRGTMFSEIFAVSAGSCHAMSFKSKQRGRAFRSCVDHIGNWRYCSVRSLILTGDMFGVKYCYDDLPNRLDLFDYESYSSNPARLYAVCTDVDTGKPKYIEVSDGLSDIVYVRASSSLPLVSRTVQTEYGRLLDGGVSDSIPIKKALEENDRCVVVLTRQAGYRKSPNKYMSLMKLRYAKYPEFIKAAERRHEVYNETLDFISKAEADGRALVIRPSITPDISLTGKDKAKLKTLYDLGYADASALADRIGRFI